MKKMGIAKQQKEKQDSRDRKSNNRVVMGAPSGPEGVRHVVNQVQGHNVIIG